jgi:hypothetical protein
MYPFAPAPGTFTGTRPTAQQPDAELSDDDRTGLHILYQSPLDTMNVGSIRGHILPANPLSLPAAPPGVSGVFGAHVVALDAASGAVIALEPSADGAALILGPCSSMGATRSIGCLSATATWSTPSRWTESCCPR